jgi:hypothetical protein
VAQTFIEVEGKSKKDCASQISRKLHEAEIFGLHKSGETLYARKDGKLKAMVVIRS